MKRISLLLMIIVLNQVSFLKLIANEELFDIGNSSSLLVEYNFMQSIDSYLPEFSNKFNIQQSMRQKLFGINLDFRYYLPATTGLFFFGFACKYLSFHQTYENNDNNISIETRSNAYFGFKLGSTHPLSKYHDETNLMIEPSFGYYLGYPEINIIQNLPNTSTIPSTLFADSISTVSIKNMAPMIEFTCKIKYEDIYHQVHGNMFSLGINLNYFICFTPRYVGSKEISELKDRKLISGFSLGLFIEYHFLNDKDYFVPNPFTPF